MTPPDFAAAALGGARVGGALPIGSEGSRSAHRLVPDQIDGIGYGGGLMAIAWAPEHRVMRAMADPGHGGWKAPSRSWRVRVPGSGTGQWFLAECVL